MKRTPVENLIREINDCYINLVKSEKRTTKEAIILGNKFINLKKISKKIKGKRKSWGKFLEEKFPQISIRQIQRLIRLANYIDIDKHKYLLMVSQNQLLDLIRISGKIGVHKYLKKNNIITDFNENDKGSINNFLKKINHAVSFQKKSSKKKRNESKTQNDSKAQNYSPGLRYKKWLTNIVKKEGLKPETIKHIKIIKKLIEKVLKKHSKQ
ncbi:MAG: hypothetical protein ACYDBT_09925 [Desulfobulbaceae bacterium]